MTEKRKVKVVLELQGEIKEDPNQFLISLEDLEGKEGSLKV